MHTAMIFAAGLGTRLKPLTDYKPKALVELAGKTMLQRTVEKLYAAGIRKIVVNIHHFPDLMVKAINNIHCQNLEILISDESEQLLDTGGGLKKARDLLISGNNPILIHNVDVISDIDIRAMILKHQKEKAIATLAVSERNTSRYFLWHDNQLHGWQNTSTMKKIIVRQTDQILTPLAFSGIQIVDPAIFDLVTEEGSFSITPLYLRLAHEHTIASYEHNAEMWADIGTIEKLARAEKLIEKNPEKYH